MGHHPPSTPVLHQFHQYCLRPKKHTSSNNMCCVCLFVMVTTGYVMAVLLSCFIYLVPIPLWSINTATICTYPLPREAESCPGLHTHTCCTAQAAMCRSLFSPACT